MRRLIPIDMEMNLDTQHGIASLLISIVILLSINVLKEIVKFAYKVWKKKDELSEQTIKDLTDQLKRNTKAVQSLDVDLRKYQKDLNLAYRFIKELAGEKWPSIKKSVMEDKDFDV